MKRILEAIWVPTDRCEGSSNGRTTLEMRWLIEIVSDRPCGIDLQAIDIVAASDPPEAHPQSRHELGLRQRLAMLYPSAAKSRGWGWELRE
jgi:hypothetical protein